MIVAFKYQDKQMQSISQLMNGQTLLPIIQANSVQVGLDIANAMADAGLKLVEVVLRTPESLEAMTEIKKAFPQLIVGAGTVYNPVILDNAIKAGADYIVTPTTTDSMLSALQSCGLPFLPGVSNLRDIAGMLENDVNEMKLFPAAQCGGVGFLKAISSLFNDAQFCPTGGVTADNKAEFLSLPNVFAVGGTWVAKPEWIEKGQWQNITAACKQAIA